MNSNDDHEQINLAMRDLSVRWTDLSAVWGDAVHDEFERDYILPFKATVAVTRRALDDLYEAVHRVRVVAAP